MPEHFLCMSHGLNMSLSRLLIINFLFIKNLGTQVTWVNLLVNASKQQCACCRIPITKKDSKYMLACMGNNLSAIIVWLHNNLDG